MTIFALAPTTLPEAAPLDYVSAAAGAGYDAIGLRTNQSPALPFSPIVGDAPLIREIKRILSDTGLTVMDIFSFYLEPDTDSETFRAGMELGAEFGGRFALIMSTDPDWPRLCDGFAKTVEIAAEYGLICAIEPSVTRPLASHRQSEQLILDSGCPTAVLCVDPLNLVRAGEGAKEITAMEPRLFPFAQLTDGFVDPGGFDAAMLGKMSPNRRAMMGKGDLPVGDILDALPAGIPLSVEIPVSLGVVEGQSEPTASEWAKRSLQDARDFMADYESRRSQAASQ